MKTEEEFVAMMKLVGADRFVDEGEDGDDDDPIPYYAVIDGVDDVDAWYRWHNGQVEVSFPRDIGGYTEWEPYDP